MRRDWRLHNWNSSRPIRGQETSREIKPANQIFRDRRPDFVGSSAVERLGFYSSPNLQ